MIFLRTSKTAQAVYSNYQEVNIATLALAYDFRSEVVENFSQLQHAKSTLIEVRTVGGKNTDAFTALKEVN